jgi:sporulation protein YqfC
MSTNKLLALKAAISEALDLPGEITLDLPKIIIIGYSQMLIENHRGVIEYTPKKIRLNSGIGVIKIEGTDLNLKSIATDDIIVTGKIKTVNFI